MVRRIIRWLASHNVTNLVLNLHHRPETLTSIVGDGRDLGVRARYSWEQPQVLGSAGGPRLALPIIGAPRFFIVNGDTLIDLALDDTRRCTCAGLRAQVTLALVPNREFMRYGGARIDQEGCVTGFVGRGARAAGSYHFIGAQVAEAAVFSSLPPGEPCLSIGGVYDRLMTSQPGTVRGYICRASFWDVGTVRDYWNTSIAFKDSFEARDRDIGHHGSVDPTAQVTRSILWDDVRIGANAIVDECIVTDGVTIAEGARYRRVVLKRGDRGEAQTSTLDIDQIDTSTQKP